MQPLARAGLSSDEVRQIVTDVNVQTEAGVDLLDTSNSFVEDISEWLVPERSEVSRNPFATVHGSCQLAISKDLDWGRDRVRPWLKLSSPVGGFRVDLGVFVLSTPDTTAGESPRTWEVEGYDLLEVLNHPHGETFVAEQGDSYLTLVTNLVEAAGLDVSLSSVGEGKTLSRDRLWPIDGDTTTLNIVNDLLAASGYRGIYMRWDGVLRSEPYVRPSQRGVEWTYDADSENTIVGPLRTLTADFFDAPNAWAFILDDPDAGDPTEGDGLYTVVNQSDGRTSIDARGRTITRIEKLDAADQDSLESQGDQMVDSDLRVTEEFADLTVGVNPLHHHMDVVQVKDSDLGFDRKCLVRSWSLPLDGSDMQLHVRGV